MCPVNVSSPEAVKTLGKDPKPRTLLNKSRKSLNSDERDRGPSRERLDSKGNKGVAKRI